MGMPWVCCAAMHAFDSVEDYWTHWRDGHAGPRHYRDVNARLLVEPAAVKNMLPVDDCVSVCVAARNSKTAAGTTFNIVSSDNIPVAVILDVLQHVMEVTGYVCDPTLSCNGTTRGSIVERVAYRNTRLFWPYTLNTEPRWETGNVDRLGVSRVLMSEHMFEFMMRHFVRELAPTASLPGSRQD